MILMYLVKVSSPFKVSKLLAVANMSEKHLRIHLGVVYPSWGAMETTPYGVPWKPPPTRQKNKKSLSEYA